MGARHQDGPPDGSRGAGGSNHAESGRCSPMGTIGALNPAGSECDRADWAVNDLLFPSSGHKMPLSLLSWERQLLRFEGQGGRETGKRPVTFVQSAPHPHQGTERLSVTQPEASPGLGTVWPLSPGPGSHLGLSPGNRCQGKREMCVQRCWPGWVWGLLKKQLPSGAAGMEGRP